MIIGAAVAIARCQGTIRDGAGVIFRPVLIQHRPCPKNRQSSNFSGRCRSFRARSLENGVHVKALVDAQAGRNSPNSHLLWVCLNGRERACLVGLRSLDVYQFGPILGIEHIAPPESRGLGDPQARIGHHGCQGYVQLSACVSCLLRFKRASSGYPRIERRRPDRGQGVCIERPCRLQADTQLPRQAPKRFRNAGRLWRLQTLAPVCIDIAATASRSVDMLLPSSASSAAYAASTSAWVGKGE